MLNNQSLLNIYLYNVEEGCTCCRWCGVRKRTPHKEHCEIEVARRLGKIGEIESRRIAHNIELAEA